PPVNVSAPHNRDWQAIEQCHRHAPKSGAAWKLPVMVVIVVLLLLSAGCSVHSSDIIVDRQLQALVVLASSALHVCTDTYHAGTGYCLGLHQQQQRAYVLECGNYHCRYPRCFLYLVNLPHYSHNRKLGMSAGLQATFSSTSTPSMYLLPNDAAFRLLLLELASQGQQTNPQFGYDRAALLADPRLPGILLYHVIPGAGQITRRMELFDGQRFFSLNNRMVTVLRWAGSNKQGPPLLAAASSSGTNTGASGHYRAVATLNSSSGIGTEAVMVSSSSSGSDTVLEGAAF
ncbi:hypothetical protein QJQ45_028731, partial [Haematococcus lacustris]